MVIKIIKSFFVRIFKDMFKGKKNLSLGFSGPPNAGKTSLANKICKDWTGEDIGKVSKVPHETRKIQFKEEVEKTEEVFTEADTPLEFKQFKSLKED